MTAADEARAEAWKAQRAKWLQEADNPTVAIAQSWFIAGWSARDSEVADLTAQLQAAQATIADAKGWADNSWGYTEKVQIKEIRRYLSRADLSTLAEHDRKVAEGAWDEGKSYEIEYPSGDEDSDGNPYRASIEQTEADREPRPEDGPDYHAEHAYWLARHAANPSTTPKETR